MSTAQLLAATAAALAAALAVELAGIALSLRGRLAFAGRAARAASLIRVASALASPLAQAQLVGRLVAAADLERRVVVAGRPGNLTVRDWVTVKACAGAALALAAVPLALSAPGRSWVVPIATGLAAGFLGPDFWLGRAGRARASQALRDLPDMLDLLRVAIAAGSSPPQALAAVAGRFDGVLADEWQRVAAAVVLGAPVDQTLAELGERLPAGPVRAFAEAMRSAGSHGRPLADVLASLARGARHARRQRIREQAARAGPKIQLIVALVLVPSVMLTIAAGLASELGSAGLGR